MASLSWLLGRWNCAYTFASDGFHAQQEAHLVYSAAADGLRIDKSVSGRLFGADYHGSGTIEYDTARKLWVERDRSASGSIETLESHEGFGASMQFEGTDSLHAVTLRVRQVGILDPAKTLWNLTNQHFYGGVWRTTSNAVCLKEGR